MSIRLRLTIWYSGILAVTLLIFSVAVYFFLSYLLYSNQKHQLATLGDEIYGRMQTVGWTTPNGASNFIVLPDLSEFKYSGFIIQAVNPNGQIAGKSRPNDTLPPPSELRSGKIAHQPFYSQEVISGYNLLIYNYPIFVKDQLAGVLQVAALVDPITNTLYNLRIILFLLALVTIVTAASLGWFLARKALKPIEDVIVATDRIEKGDDLNHRIPYDGPPGDEIGRLTYTINGMLSRIQVVYSELEELYRAQRRFVSDASHELRTPLTTIRGNVELLEKMWLQAAELPEGGAQDNLKVSLEAMQDIAGEAKRMSRLVNDLLSLARADSGYRMEKNPFEMRTTIEEVARRAQFLAKQVEWQVGDISAIEGVWVLGNRDYVQQLLFILIENAFKYTEAGYVRMDAECLDTQVGIHISDTGAGMDKEDVPLIFDRFYRADLSRGITSGTGLGLSIAQWIIDQHGGSIEVKTRKGQGSVFTIWLPVYFHPELN